MGSKTIRVTCEAAETIDYRDVVEIQGKFKFRTDADDDKIITSILKYGFSFPFFAWRFEEKPHCLDGHGRLRALRKLEESGYTIPALPVVWIHAKNLEEAKQKLLRINSQYGKITSEGVFDFLAGLQVDWAEISLPAGELVMQIDDPVDLTSEWVGMPEFIQEDKEAYRQILVSFENETDVQDFARIIGQKITEKTRYIWHPKQKIDKVADIAYQDE